MSKFEMKIFLIRKWDIIRIWGTNRKNTVFWKIHKFCLVYVYFYVFCKFHKFCLFLCILEISEILEFCLVYVYKI